MLYQDITLCHQTEEICIFSGSLFVQMSETILKITAVHSCLLCQNKDGDMKFDYHYNSQF